MSYLNTLFEEHNYRITEDNFLLIIEEILNQSLHKSNKSLKIHVSNINKFCTKRNMMMLELAIKRFKIDYEYLYNECKTYNNVKYTKLYSFSDEE